MSDAICTTPRSTPTERAVRWILAAATLVLLAACGPIEVRSAPPGSDLDGLAVDGEELVLRLRIDNRNDVPLTLAGARLKLELGNLELEPREWPLAIDVGARGLEAIDLRLPASGAALGLLDELERGERASLPYTLTGDLQIAEGRDARVRREGYLHPVPGRPGRYR